MYKFRRTQKYVFTTMKQQLKLTLFLLITIVLQRCIQNDFIDDTVEERISIDNPIEEIQVTDIYQMSASFFNNIGEAEQIDFTWTSSSPSVISISNTGLINALTLGNSTIRVEATNRSNLLFEEFNITTTLNPVDNNEIRTKTGMITTTSSYVLTGDFTISEIPNSQDLDLSLKENYRASTSLPGLYVYLSNNPNSINGAIEIGRVNVFNGEHSYQISNAEINDYKYILYWCKPFSVKVGHGQINN